MVMCDDVLYRSRLFIWFDDPILVSKRLDSASFSDSFRRPLRKLKEEKNRESSVQKPTFVIKSRKVKKQKRQAPAVEVW